jgi:hypothetical protein
MDAFAAKLAFVMKALSLSRGRLGMELAVDKSVVSRWLSGARTPSSNNIASISALVARRAHGFTMLDWDLPESQIAARLGLGPEGAPLAQVEAAPELASFQSWLSLPKLREAASGDPDAAEATKGFWRAIAPMPGMPDKFGQSFSKFSMEADGTMRVETGFFNMRRVGWSVAVGNQFFSCVTGTTDGYFGFTIVNRTHTPVIDVLDGIFLGCMADNGGVPMAMPIVMERIGDLSGDEEQDAARLTELLMMDPIMAAEDVAEPIRRRLWGSAEPGPEAASRLLTMAALTSLARGRHDRA